MVWECQSRRFFKQKTSESLLDSCIMDKKEQIPVGQIKQTPPEGRVKAAKQKKEIGILLCIVVVLVTGPEGDVCPA